MRPRCRLSAYVTAKRRPCGAWLAAANGHRPYPLTGAALGQPLRVLVGGSLFLARWGGGIGSGTVWDRFASCTQLVARTGLPVAGGECLGAWCF